LEFNVPFQHKYGYIRDEGRKGKGRRGMEGKEGMREEERVNHAGKTARNANLTKPRVRQCNHGVLFFAKFCLDHCILLPLRGEKLLDAIQQYLTKLSTFGGSCTHPFTNQGQIWCARDESTSMVFAYMPNFI